MMKKIRQAGCFAVLLGLALFQVRDARPADWPTYRNDIARSGAAGDAVEPPLGLAWRFTPMHEPKPAWPQPGEERARMHFDSAHHVAIGHGMVYFGSTVDDHVYAVDLETGEIRWTHCAGGPVRFAPTLADGRVYFGSDDGLVYCLDAEDGKTVWTYRPGPSNERILGNGRMISVWPVRTSVIVDRGQVLFAAGVFPNESVYICALDAETGKEIWVNGTIADRAHELNYGGISPQSYLIASESALYVPSGRAMPAAFSRETGEFLFYLSPGGKTGGTWALLDQGELIAGVERQSQAVKIAYDADTGERKGDKYAWFPGVDMVVTPDVSLTLTDEGLYAINRAEYPDIDRQLRETRGRMGQLQSSMKELRDELANADEARKTEIANTLDAITGDMYELGLRERELKSNTLNWNLFRPDLSTLILAGETVCAGGENVVLAADLKTGEVRWEETVEGNVLGLAAAGGYLIASTDSGDIYAFHSKPAREPNHVWFKKTGNPYAGMDKPAGFEAVCEDIATGLENPRGYALVLDAGEGRLAFEIATRTEMQVIALEKDPAQLAEARRRLMDAGLYGSRVVAEPWDPYDLPDYFATLIVSDGMLETGELRESPADLFRVLKPCGGKVLFYGPGGKIKLVPEANATAWSEHFPGAKTSGFADGLFRAEYTRGPLEGAGEWTSLYGNPQNTACSGDQLVKAPLGVLWFGEPGSEHIVDRHGRSAGPLALDGKLFIQGEETLMCYDAYNGAFLWQRPLDGAVRVRVDVDGSNLSMNSGGLYVASKDKCFRLNLETGETETEYSLPLGEGQYAGGSESRRWGYIMSLDDQLIGSAALPQKAEYGALWDMMVTEDGSQWRPMEEIEAQLPEGSRNAFANYFSQFLETFPEPDADAAHKFNEDGLLWRVMDDFPTWLSEKDPQQSFEQRMLISDSIFSLDPETGAPRWVYRGKEIANIAPTVGEGVMYITERSIPPEEREAGLRERESLIERGVYETGGEAELDEQYYDVRKVVALDLNTGETLWEKPIDFTGCGGYRLGSAYHEDGILLFFGHFSNHDRGLFRDGSLVWRRITAVSAKDGEVLWSKPLNYLRRPVVVGDMIIIEPRACSVFTGDILFRRHPVSGEEVPWEFFRPGHSCSVTTASADCMFFRSYNNAFYDLAEDRGLSYFGGIRTGCWVNYIPANGLLMIPESSSGCTCSFPLRCTVVLKNRKPKRPRDWTVFITNGPMTPARRLAVNFGAPGDMLDDGDRMWFGYPRPETAYGMKFDLNEEANADEPWFGRDFMDTEIEGDSRSWLFTNGATGLTKFELPLIDDVWGEKPGRYTLNLGFAALPGDKPGARVFDIVVQGEVVRRGFDPAAETGGANRAAVLTFSGIEVANRLRVELIPSEANPSPANAPLIQYAEALMESGPAELAGAAELPEAADPGEALAKAVRFLEERETGKALPLLHAVFVQSQPGDWMRQALEGMARAGDPSSLPYLARFRDANPILWDYKMPDTDVFQAARKACLSIAVNLKTDDPGRAEPLLKHLLAQTPEEDPLRETIAAHLRDLGATMD